MATPSVSNQFLHSQSVGLCLTLTQNPPLYLHITSTSKEGLEQAVEKIEELMKQELPNLVDERRFRRREPEQVERDELGRVRSQQKIVLRSPLITGFISVNGQKSGFQSTLNRFPGST